MQNCLFYVSFGARNLRLVYKIFFCNSVRQCVLNAKMIRIVVGPLNYIILFGRKMISR